MDNTSTEKFGDLILEKFSRDRLLETSKHPNTTSSIVGDPNFVDFVDPVQAKALLDNSIIHTLKNPK